MRYVLFSGIMLLQDKDLFGSSSKWSFVAMDSLYIFFKGRFWCFSFTLFLNSFVNVSLKHNKSLVFKVYNLTHFAYVYSNEPIITIKIRNISITPKNFLIIPSSTTLHKKMKLNSTVTREHILYYYYYFKYWDWFFNGTVFGLPWWIFSLKRMHILFWGAVDKQFSHTFLSTISISDSMCISPLYIISNGLVNFFTVTQPRDFFSNQSVLLCGRNFGICKELESLSHIGISKKNN